MSRDGTVRLVFFGEERPFRLAIGQLRALQEACKAGPMTIFRRLVSGEYFVDDIRETIRLGLIGGGATDKDAFRIVANTVDAGVPLDQHCDTAATILEAALLGPEDEKPKKQKGAKAPADPPD